MKTGVTVPVGIGVTGATVVIGAIVLGASRVKRRLKPLVKVHLNTTTTRPRSDWPWT